MMKNLFTSFFAFCLLTGNAMATDINLRCTNQTQNEIPQVVKQFLATPAGKGYSVSDVMKAYAAVKRLPSTVSESTNIVSTVMVDEDFSKWTKGSETAPDTVDVYEKLDSLNNMPGWGGYIVYEAGGKAYLGYDQVGDDGPGYLKTPVTDLSSDGGIFKATFRVKNVNPDVTDQLLQYFIMDENPDKKKIVSANSLPLSTEWQDLTLTLDDGVKNTSIMFLGWKGKVLVDNVKVEKLVYPLSKPVGIKAEVAGGGKISAQWDAVENAQSYTVELFDTDDNKTVSTATSSTNSAELVGAFNPEHKFYVYVTAENGTDKSYPGRQYVTFSVASVDAPVAKEATDISTSGFTANWETSEKAANYKLTLIRTRTAAADGETVTYMDEGFDEIPYTSDDVKSTIVSADFISPTSLDEVLNTQGWSTMVATAFTGYLGITNMYAVYGMPGVLLSPISDYSIGEGKVKVSGNGMSLIDDVQVKVGFGKYALGQVTFNEGAQTFELSQTGSDFNVEVSGGKADSRLIFQIVDAAEGGDIALFDSLHITSTLKEGESYTMPYSSVTLPYDATSYKVEVPFTGNDIFDYYVTGSFGSVTSAKSNTITVKSPEYTDGISAVETGTDSEAMFTTIGGVRVSTPATHGIYIVKKDGKTFKMMK